MASKPSLSGGRGRDYGRKTNQNAGLRKTVRQGRNPHVLCRQRHSGEGRKAGKISMYHKMVSAKQSFLFCAIKILLFSIFIQKLCETGYVLASYSICDKRRDKIGTCKSCGDVFVDFIRSLKC